MSAEPGAERSDTPGKQYDMCVGALKAQKRFIAVWLFSRLGFLAKPYNLITTKPNHIHYAFALSARLHIYH